MAAPYRACIRSRSFSLWLRPCLMFRAIALTLRVGLAFAAAYQGLPCTRVSLETSVYSHLYFVDFRENAARQPPLPT
jgi:hypothetical protein